MKIPSTEDLILQFIFKIHYHRLRLVIFKGAVMLLGENCKLSLATRS